MYGLCHHANENGQITFVREVTSETRSLEAKRSGVIQAGTLESAIWSDASRRQISHALIRSDRAVAQTYYTLTVTALLRKVQEMCSAQELTSESAQRPGAPSYIARRGRRATAAAAAVVGSRCLSRGRKVAPIPVRPKRRRSAELGVTYSSCLIIRDFGVYQCDC
ncbi:unnamed protein product [Trichogramma brassicae]|uniref:Uncharacterized protein n=1 Tax=Trichogramma brassicae TaxID=86971 RepID=A0A6H5I6Q6_9HYME|nr:unnamed protein product [Trichogramma brassicae]